MRAADRARPAGPRPRAAPLRFRHTLIRDVAYASLAKSARARAARAACRLARRARRRACRGRRAHRLPPRDRLPLRARDRRRRAARARERAGERLAAAADVAHGARRSRRRDRLPRPRHRAARRRDAAGRGAAAGSGLRAVRVRRVRPRRGARRPRGRGQGALGLDARRRPARASSASTSGSPATRRRSAPERSLADVDGGGGHDAALGDELGLARAAYLLSDLVVAAGRPGRLLRARRGDARLRAPRGQRLRRRDGARVHGVVPGRGPVAGARGDRALRGADGRTPSARAGSACSAAARC